VNQLRSTGKSHSCCPVTSKACKMVVAPGGNAANDDAKPENIVAPAAFKPEIPHLAEDDTSATVLKIASVNADAGSANDDADQEQARINPSSLRAPESARFESGLYKLNCQLYRFRLELDQEMEFREELLHSYTTSASLNARRRHQTASINISHAQSGTPNTRNSSLLPSSVTSVAQIKRPAAQIA